MWNPSDHFSDVEDVCVGGILEGPAEQQQFGPCVVKATPEGLVMHVNCSACGSPWRVTLDWERVLQAAVGGTPIDEGATWQRDGGQVTIVCECWRCKTNKRYGAPVRASFAQSELLAYAYDQHGWKPVLAAMLALLRKDAERTMLKAFTRIKEWLRPERRCDEEQPEGWSKDHDGSE